MMNADRGRDMYLDLLTRSLMGLIDEDPSNLYPASIGEPSELAAHDRERRVIGQDWPRRAPTMIGEARLGNIRFCIEEAMKDGVPGDLIETGVWRGGATIFMRAVSKSYQVTDRRVWVADSFEGLPAPNVEKYPHDRGMNLENYKELAVSLEEVKANFSRYGLLDDQVMFLKGWFRDTLPDAPIASLAVMRLDGDLYESTMDALVNLYGRLSRGGFVIIDDYQVPACRQAVHDFRNREDITDPIVAIDWAGVYWRRS
jgi:hypothetical protein